MDTGERYDAVLLAGASRNPRRWVKGQNKAFLELRGMPMVRWVALQILKCSKISNLIIVGQRDKLESVFADIITQPDSRIKITQQRSRMLENVWAGFLTTFSDGNNLPRNQEIDTLLLGGQLPIKRQRHLTIIKSVYSAVADYMAQNKLDSLPRQTVMFVMERRFDSIRRRHERAEWFMGRIGIQTILKNGIVLKETESGIRFHNKLVFDYFLDWERRLNKRIFVTATDLPLLTPESIRDFIQKCEGTSADFYFSVASEDVLKPYYIGKNGSPGIIRPYLHLREAKIRSSNLILVAPNLIGNKELVQLSFGIRKMTEWGNVFRLIWNLVKQKYRSRTIRLAAALQTAAVLDRNGWVKMSEIVRRLIRSSELETAIGRLFVTRFKIIASTYGGVSLDVDTDDDYDRLLENLEYWLDIQENFVKAHPLEHLLLSDDHSSR